MIKMVSLALVYLIFNCHNSKAFPITWHKQNATIWLSEQIISGEVNDSSITSLIIHHDHASFIVPVNKNHFTSNFHFHNAVNKIWAVAQNNAQACSDTLVLTLGYQLLPVIRPIATVQGNKVLLHAFMLNNPASQPLNYLWKADVHNPFPVVIHRAKDSIAEVSIPNVDGEYNFILTVASGTDTAIFAAMVTRNSEGVVAFNIETSHAAWINKAIIYEITPHLFTDSANYSSITAKLPELRYLGINTIWLQPLYKTKYGGQGYDVTDYFSLRSAFGSEEELKKLIATAKQLGMHVLFDFVPNHTSVFHPYAQDCLVRGAASPYYNFYQHTNDGSPYSSKFKASGSFIGYFWKDLVNLDFTNVEVQQWILEACKFWLKKYDIDGYRFDAMWAINARAPLFGKRLQQELKSIKPGLLLLAEDKPSPATYQKGFDVAYDWAADTSWISKWRWQSDYDEKKSLTIFNNAAVIKRSSLLKKALFDNGDETKLKLRFIENNDLPRFIKSHDAARTKMAAALIFTLPGIPMLYNGQEIGSPNHPYSKKAIFNSGQSIQSQDTCNLFEYYRQLTAIRLKHESLYGGRFQKIPASDSQTVVAFKRWTNNENIVVIINMGDRPVNTELDVSSLKTPHLPLCLQDLLENKTALFRRTKNGFIKIHIDGYTTKILLQK